MNPYLLPDPGMMAYQRHFWRNETIFALLLLMLCAGCREQVSFGVTATIENCERPNTVDLSRIDIFSVKLNNDDLLTTTPHLASGSQIELTGSVILKQELRTRGDTPQFVVGFREIVNGRADWSIPPCRMPRPAEWKCSTRETSEGDVLIARFQHKTRLDLNPGEYALRFYVIITNSLSEELPVVFHVGQGRLVVTSPEEQESG